MKTIKLSCSIFACLTVALTSVSADTLSIDGVWHTQYELMGASGEYFSTSYTATQPESVEVTGYWDNTDQYNVYVDGSLVLTTPSAPGSTVPIDYGDTFGTYTDPSTAWNSGLFSQGIFTVNDNDVILIQDIGPLFPDPAMASNDAQVGLQAIAPIPEPASAVLMVLSFAVLVFSLRVFRKATLLPRRARGPWQR